MFQRVTVSFVAILLVGSLAIAAENNKPGFRTILSQDFATSADSAWHLNHGTWKIVDRAWQATEDPSEKHPAAARYRVGEEFTDAVFEFDFRFDGAKAISLSINDLSRHLCHFRAKPMAVQVLKDDSDAEGPDKSEVLASVKANLAPGEWHHARVVIEGDTMRAEVSTIPGESRVEAVGKHKLIAAAKENFALVVSGETASFRNLRVSVLDAKAAKVSSAERVLAFPEAEGAGRFTTGGRGGEVVHVTNLKAKGPGSLADAVRGPNRIVVFDVSGIIDLTNDSKGKLRGGEIAVEHPNITIAGQTAPGEGICLRGGVLHVAAGNVIVRHLRSRRGWICDEDTGDAIVVEPPHTGELTSHGGTTQEVFDKKKEKKEERGKTIRGFAPMANVVIDHCSTSWATDENLSVTHADHTTVAWSIAAEGLDYPNPKQTPPRHSEGSLWGSEAEDGRSTMHHMLYVHNRLRNPRTVGGGEVPAVLNFYNNVVYNWSEFPSHTGSQRVLLNWLNNVYKPGRDTPEDARSTMFVFQGDPGSRIYAHGNVVEGSNEATADNKRAIAFDNKFKKTPAEEREAMKVDAPFADAPAGISSAAEAYEIVLDEVGATLPARDAVDLRIVESVRNGKGHVIDKETDLAKRDRWPDYRSLPPLPDRDGDGLPDFWEFQFRSHHEKEDNASTISNGYSNIEHYFNSTDPRGADTPVVLVSAIVSRATNSKPGQWRITRHGSTELPLTVRYELSGDAKSDKDYVPLDGSVTIEAGKRTATILLVVREKTRDDRTVVLSLVTEQHGCHVGCPAQSLIAIRN
ncbi:MAG TPA: hypothetical protein VHV77_17775 [Pirellulales bacterium]|nr:hypothetical protein [Pirellulales bacterium]